MARTTAELVEQIIRVRDSDDLTPFINMANQLVEELLVPLDVHTDERLELIERNLAAHHYEHELKKARSQETAGAVQASYFFKVDLGFKGTSYGQNAMRLDTTGTLAALDNSMNKVTTPLPASRRDGTGMISWLGSDDC